LYLSFRNNACYLDHIKHLYNNDDDDDDDNEGRPQHNPQTQKTFIKEMEYFGRKHAHY